MQEYAKLVKRRILMIDLDKDTCYPIGWNEVGDDNPLMLRANKHYSGVERGIKWNKTAVNMFDENVICTQIAEVLRKLNSIKIEEEKGAAKNEGDDEDDPPSSQDTNDPDESTTKKPSDTEESTVKESDDEEDRGDNQSQSEKESGSAITDDNEHAAPHGTIEVETTMEGNTTAGKKSWWTRNQTGSQA